MARWYTRRHTAMPTRRAFLLGAASTVSGGAILGSEAFAASVSPDADLRIIALPPPDFVLLPCSDDEHYVETDAAGHVMAIELGGTTGPGQGVNTRARTDFACVFRMKKHEPGNPIDEVYFNFDVRDTGLGPEDPTPAEIEAAMRIISPDGADIAGTGAVNYLKATDVGDAHNDLLNPNPPHVPMPVGIAVDLLASGIEDLPDPDRFEIRLQIDTSERGGGPPQ